MSGLLASLQLLAIGTLCAVAVAAVANRHVALFGYLARSLAVITRQGRAIHRYNPARRASSAIRRRRANAARLRRQRRADEQGAAPAGDEPPTRPAGWTSRKHED